MSTRFTLLSLLLLLTSCGQMGHESIDVPLALRACARLSGCADLSVELFDGEVLGGVNACRFSSSFAFYSAPNAPECIVAAADCEGVVACLDRAEVGSCEPDETSTPSCDGDVQRSCASGAPVSRDCAAEGLRCQDGSCVRDETCEGSRCDGDTLSLCPVGGAVEIVRECPTGLCGVDDEGFGRCRPSQIRCDRWYCEGDVAVKCIDGFERRQLCLPGRCSESDGAFCMSDVCVDACRGEVMEACTFSGRQVDVDCAEWGATCADDERGVRCAVD